MILIGGVVIVMRFGHGGSLSMDPTTVTISSKRRATTKPTDSEDKTNLEEGRPAMSGDATLPAP